MTFGDRIREFRRRKKTPRRSTAGRIRPGCHAHVFVSMECPGLPESLGHAHEDVSMAPKSLAEHHLRFIGFIAAAPLKIP